MAQDTVQQSKGTARVLSFEDFVRRTVRDSEQAPTSDAPQSPFGNFAWLRPLSRRQITHRQTMLMHFRRQR